MPAKYVIEELDDQTREYLLQVKQREGKGMPGVYAPKSNVLPIIGIIAGPILICVTLIGTFASRLILNDPDGLALLQTAGIVLGGWMFLAAIRGWAASKSASFGGRWLYVDPLYLYEAKAEEVIVTPVDDVVEARFTHTFDSNGNYSSSTVAMRMDGKRRYSVSIKHQARAEAISGFMNYLAWARGPEGGERATLTPVVLGGLAKYVSKNDAEPLDSNGNVDLSSIRSEINEVPEEPRRDGHSRLNFFPYLLIIIALVTCFFVMRTINVPYRDDAIYEAVTVYPMEPRLLRTYLIDPRNTRHRDHVYTLLGEMYTRKLIGQIEKGGNDLELRLGMVKVLEQLKKADIPVVSIRIKEKNPPDGKAAEREEQLQKGIAAKVVEVFSKLEPPVDPPPDVVFTEQPPPVGEQLIDFLQAPEDANPHFEITYRFEPVEDRYKVKYEVTIRASIEDEPIVNKKEFTLPNSYRASELSRAIDVIKDNLVADMVGVLASQPPPNPVFPPPNGFPPGKAPK